MPKQRCEKHQIFIGKSGCKICNDINKTRSTLFQEIFEKNKEIKALTEENNRLKSKELSPEIKHAISWLSRNEKPIFINMFAAESIIASVHDLYLKIPEGRRNMVKPLIDHIMNIVDNLNELDTEMATKASKAMGAKEYNEMIIETIRVLDASAGKIKNCETCVHSLDRKKLIRSELAKGKI